MTVLFDNHIETDFSEFDSESVDEPADLTWSADAALVGSGGAKNVVDGTGQTWLQSNMGSWSTQFLHIRFWFDPNGMTIGDADEFRLMQSAGREMVVNFGYTTAGGYWLEAEAENDSGAKVGTGQYALSDEPHFIEYRMRRNDDAGTPNAEVSLYVDGNLQETKGSLDIFDWTRPPHCRVGLCSGFDTGMSGTFYFDEIKGIDTDDLIDGPVSGLDVVLVDHHLRQLANN